MSDGEGGCGMRMRQLKVMLNKHWLVRRRSMGQNVQLFIVPVVALLVVYLFYEVWNKGESTGILELVFVPFSLIFLQFSGVVNLVAEKAARLVETMKIMSLKTDVYYLAYFIEGVLAAAVQAVILASVASGLGLFNEGSWVLIFGLIWAFCVATNAVSFFIASLFDIPQSASILALAFYFTCLILFWALPDLQGDIKRYNLSPEAQRAWCLLPPIALEFGINSFRGPPTQDKFTRPVGSKKWGDDCSRHTNVVNSFNCPELAAKYGITNYDVGPTFPHWRDEEDISFGGVDIYAYEMMEGSRWPAGFGNNKRGSYDYFNLTAGECYRPDADAELDGAGRRGLCTDVSRKNDDPEQSCLAICDDAMPDWFAINLYAEYEQYDDDDKRDDSGYKCCCQPSCDCTRPSSRGPGVLMVRSSEATSLPGEFCESGGVKTSGTFRRKKKYTQYNGLNLGNIIVMLMVDVVIYSVLAWYFGQVWPSEFGVQKPWYFPFVCCCPKKAASEEVEEKASDRAVDDAEAADDVVIEPDVAHEGVAPTVAIHKLRKVFGSHVAVDGLSFDLHASEIFSLLGHNGAGKTTSINVLTGILDSDSREKDGGATIFGHPIRGDLDGARSVTGVCPQHDVLFQNLTTREHLTFFARLKGSTVADASAEADELLSQFHLSERGGHLGHELSGGMRRKLSTAVALCGRSKFVLLDEPTAGMDALARRELWDLLAAAKKDRTVLLTTHYMDEADVLGDRIGIMSHGKLKCVGTSHFLKGHYGAGYRIVCEKTAGHDDKSLARFDALLAEKLPAGQRVETIAKRKIAEPTFEATLPLDSRDRFAGFFRALDGKLDELDVASYGLTITTLEEVFLAVGGDETVAPKELAAEDLGIGQGRKYEASLPVQVMGLAKKRLDIAPNDFKSVALVALPIAAGIAAFALLANETLSKKSDDQDSATAGIAGVCGWLLVPAFLAENIVFERETKLRDVLAVMGCDFRAYWLGTFVGDWILLSVAWFVVFWIAAPATGVSRWLGEGAIFWFPPILATELIFYSYAMSFLFKKAKRCLIFGSGLQIVQIYLGLFVVLLYAQIPGSGLNGDNSDMVQGAFYWVLPVFSPQGAFFMGLYSIPQKPPRYAPQSVGIVMAILVVMSVIYLSIVFTNEVAKERPWTVTMPDDEVAATAGGDDDVVAERSAVAAMTDCPKGGPYTLVVKRLRKVYPPKGSQASETVAVHDCSFRVGQGECFGLLGANGAGKSTTMDMIIRATRPTAGDAFVDGFSPLTDFHKATEALGVVAQSNTLWDKLSCENHLKLFARIRGVPGKDAVTLVENALDQLELRPHAKKLAQRLSGGMKRKLCVAIAIVGDPQCVLLDEPSAGLDPVSRRNLWNVIRATMDSRSVVLTSHLMEEVEALCDRVGIMVKGKLRCLGTIQHLKNSLGKHYEVELAIDPEKFAADPEAASTKLRGLAADCFGADATEEGPPNAGLFTYHVPQDAMQIGDVFETLEKQKDDVDLVDYSIAQPSLEAVFIRTVLDHSGKERPGAARATRSYSHDDEDAFRTHSAVETGVHEPGKEDLDLETPKFTGCVRKCHWRNAVVTWPLFVIILVVYMFTGAGILFILGIVLLLAAIWGTLGCVVFLKPENEDAKCARCCLP